MKKSVFKHLIADNKRLRKEVYTLIAEPDSLSAMEIRIAHEINHSIIKGIMFGRCKEVVREPLDQTKLDKFVEDWMKVPIQPINFTSSIFQHIERDLTLDSLKKVYSDEDYQKLISLPAHVLNGILDGSVKIECEECHIKKGVDDAKSSE